MGPGRRRSARLTPVKPHRAFDPRLVGSLETTAWVSYYRHEWVSFLRAAISLTRYTFGLPWPQTLHGAWLVLRANQLWAPFPDNDPDGARAAMQRFYAMVARQTTRSLTRSGRPGWRWSGGVCTESTSTT